MPSSNFQFSAPVGVNKTSISSFVAKTLPDITNNSLINDKLKGIAVRKFKFKMYLMYIIVRF